VVASVHTAKQPAAVTYSQLAAAHRRSDATAPTSPHRPRIDAHGSGASVSAPSQRIPAAATDEEHSSRGASGLRDSRDTTVIAASGQVVAADAPVPPVSTSAASGTVAMIGGRGSMPIAPANAAAAAAHVGPGPSAPISTKQSTPAIAPAAPVPLLPESKGARGSHISDDSTLRTLVVTPALAAAIPASYVASLGSGLASPPTVPALASTTASPTVGQTLPMSASEPAVEPPINARSTAAVTAAAPAVAPEVLVVASEPEPIPAGTVASSRKPLGVPAGPPQALSEPSAAPPAIIVTPTAVVGLPVTSSARLAAIVEKRLLFKRMLQVRGYVVVD
jgi:hypothetical protein